MAEEYGFDYELVQYKWPRWLHAQTEKQRVIWGYKILFLDVLFPLSVKKIVFVDADLVSHYPLLSYLDTSLLSSRSYELICVSFSSCHWTVLRMPTHRSAVIDRKWRGSGILLPMASRASGDRTVPCPGSGTEATGRTTWAAVATTSVPSTSLT